jgi:hypothetical protein
VSKDKDAKLENGVKESKPNDGIRNATGFDIARNGKRLRILTYAHLIDECYA